MTRTCTIMKSKKIEDGQDWSPAFVVGVFFGHTFNQDLLLDCGATCLWVSPDLLLASYGLRDVATTIYDVCMSFQNNCRTIGTINVGNLVVNESEEEMPLRVIRGKKALVNDDGLEMENEWEDRWKGPVKIVHILRKEKVGFEAMDGTIYSNQKGMLHQDRKTIEPGTESKAKLLGAPGRAQTSPYLVNSSRCVSTSTS